MSCSISRVAVISNDCLESRSAVFPEELLRESTVLNAVTDQQFDQSLKPRLWISAAGQHTEPCCVSNLTSVFMNYEWKSLCAVFLLQFIQNEHFLLAV